MKKLNLTRWLLTALAGMTVFSAPAAQKTFTAVTANVDGLPPVVHIDYGVGSRDVHMNDDGSQEPGATRMGQLIGENLWDIVALSEDFNYHANIMAGVNTYYKASKHRGKIEQKNLHGSLINYPTANATDNKGLYMETDGLCFLARKKYDVTPGVDEEKEGNNWIPWNDHYGFTDHEADGLIRKGFRFYQVTLAEGLVVDVYITHMEAGSESEDNAARAKQLIQFAEYIKAHKGTNPIIILGDTNCRYTRDPLKTGFIDLIEQDTDLHVQDPWLEQDFWKEKGGFDAPELQLGEESIMVSTYGEQRGEVVDKIWYINNDKSKCKLTCTGYLHDDSFTYADGSQIADHYPVVGTFVIENPDAPEEVITEVTKPNPTVKSGIVSGQTYYLRNLGSGKFLRAGGEYSAQAIMSDYPSKITPIANGSNYYLKTTHRNGNSQDNNKNYSEYLNLDVNGSSNYYMDQPTGDWTLTQVKDNVYRLKDRKSQSVGFNGNNVAAVSDNETDLNQQWEFLTQEDLMVELYDTSTTNNKDVTFLMKAADFGFCDQESWNFNPGSKATVGKIRPINNSTFYRGYNIQAGSGENSNNRKWDFNQTIGGNSDADKLPAGIYKVSYQAVGYNISHTEHIKINNEIAPWTNINETPDICDVKTTTNKLPMVGEVTTVNVTKNDSKVKAFDERIANELASGAYPQEFIVTVTNDGTYANKIVIEIVKPENSSSTYAAYDNFKIKCISIDGLKDMSVYDRVNIAIQDAKAKAAEAGLSNYRNGQVETLWKEREIVGDGWAEVKKTYKNLAEAVLVNKEIGADYTYALVNPSFELYQGYQDSRYNIDAETYPFGWSYANNYAYDSGVWPASDTKKMTNNPAGDYIFNSWPEGNTVYQEVTLTPGLYKVKAKVASDAGNQVYLYAGDKNKAVTTTGSADLVEIELNFPVSDGKPFELGVAGAKNGAFAKEGGVWYKADNFQLTRVGDAETIKGMEMLQLAINEVTARLNAKGWNDDYCKGELAKYQAMIDNYTLTGDGKKEFEAVYKLIRDKVFDQEGTGEIDYTYALANPSFEWGYYYGWDLKSTAGDTGVKPNSDGTYKLDSGCDGSYLFNTYQDGRGTIISQTIPNLPAGHYKLQATFANDDNRYVFLEVVGQEGVQSQKQQYIVPSAKNTGEVKVFEFDVAEGTPSITIQAGGCNSDGTWDDFGGDWYKVDNFKLTREGDAHICFFYKRLQAAIDDANAIAAKLPEYYRNQWDASDYQDLIDEHTTDHDPDAGEMSNKYDPLNGKSGIEQINTLYKRLRALIFQQKESGADMSGAITNNSFELGDLTGWTTYMEPNADAKVVATDETTPTYGTKEVHGKYLYNAYYGNRQAHPIYQVIPNMPSGKYTLTVKVASDLGVKFFLGANDQHSDIFYITKDGNRHNILDSEGNVVASDQPGEFCEFSFTFEVPIGEGSKDVKIGVYPTIASSYDGIDDSHFADDATGPWYKVDHFRLTLDSRYLEVNWKMETPTHGTIMLPFDVSAEELAAQNLEAYSIKFSEESNTPSDQDVNNYRILNWVGPHDGKEHEDGLHQDGIKAYNPYVLKNIAPVEEAESVSMNSAKLSVKAAEGEAADDPQANYTGKYYQFVGYAKYKEEDQADNASGTLTGTLVDVPAAKDQHHLAQIDDESSVGFMSHNEYGTKDEIIPAYHAYMLNPKEDFRSYDGFYFYEPLQKIELYMEAEKYGTLILPFEAELPETLKAYKLTGVSEVRNYSVVDASKGSYQVLEKEEVTANAEGKVILEENTPYLIEDLGESEREEPITFIGQANNVDGDGNGLKENSPEGNILTGLFVSRDKYNDEYMDPGHWILEYDDENDRPVFTKLTGNKNVLKAYNAYIAMPETTETPVTPAAVKAVSLLAEDGEPVQPQADELLIDEPEVSENWTMDNQYVGTLVLPFDVDAQVLIDNDLKAYKITGVETEQTKNGVTYHILQRAESTEGLTANEAYMITSTGEILTVNFKGTAGASQTPVETGLMLGTYSPITAPENSYVANAEKGLDFKKVGAEGAPVAQLHAYIPAASNLTGTYLVVNDDTVDVTEIMEGDVNVDIYTLDGVMVRRNVNAAEALQELDHGIYILRSAKGTVKVIK